MEFKNSAKPVEMFGVEEVVGMKVDASGKMFHTLFSGLYSRKEQSIVRESCANARDAHIKNGNPDRPFKVHIPSTWEPWYSVRDFGTSMTHEFVMERYSTIGYSSKDTSNIEVGSFGLGSKAPLSYTPQFAVIAFLDGERRTYNIHLSEDGTPCVALTSRAPCDEEQGLEVRFDVRSGDIETFRRAFVEVALAHPVTPECNIAGVRRASILSDHETYYRSRDVRHTQIEIGCVWYPLDWGIVTPHLNAAGASLIHANDFVIRTRIGDVAVTPSRESISYTTDTITALAGYLNGTAEVIAARHRKAVDGLTDVWAVNDYVQIHDGYERFVVNQMSTPFGIAGTLSSINVDALVRPFVEERRVGSRKAQAAGKLERSGRLPLIVRDALVERPKRETARIEHAIRGADATRAYVVTLPNPRGVVQGEQRRLIEDNVDRATQKRRLDAVYATAVRRRGVLTQLVTDYAALKQFTAEDLELPPPVKVEAGPPIMLYKPVPSANTGWGTLSSDRSELGNINLPQRTVYLAFPLDQGRFEPCVDFDQLRSALFTVTGRKHVIIGVSKSNYSRLLRRWTFLQPYDAVISRAALPMDRLLAYWRAYAETSISTAHFDAWSNLARLQKIAKGYEDLCGPLVAAVVRCAAESSKARDRARQTPQILSGAAVPNQLGCEALVKIAMGDAMPELPVGGYEAATLALARAWEVLLTDVPALASVLGQYMIDRKAIQEGRALVIGSAILREHDTAQALLEYSEALLAA